MNNLLAIDPIVYFSNGYLGENTAFTIFIKIFLSLVFASFIGIERSVKRHAAGLRTFITVSLAGTIAAIVDTYLIEQSYLSFPALSAATIIGVAVVSANTLIYSVRSQIKGLTTAVSLFLTTFIGLSLGFSLYTLSLIAFFALLFSLTLLPVLEKYLKNKSDQFDIHLELKSRTNLQDFITTIRKLGLAVDDIELNPAYHNSGLSVYTISLSIKTNELKQYKTHKEIIEALSTLEYVNSIEEIN